IWKATWLRSRLPARADFAARARGRPLRRSKRRMKRPRRRWKPECSRPKSASKVRAAAVSRPFARLVMPAFALRQFEIRRRFRTTDAGRRSDVEFRRFPIGNDVDLKDEGLRL